MERPQEKPEQYEEGGNLGKKMPVTGVRRWLYAGVVALGLGGVFGCGGKEAPTHKVEVGGPGGGPIPVKVSEEKGEGGAKVREGKKGKEKGVEMRTVAVIGQRHVQIDGRYYLKTKDWAKETVWMLPKGYRLPALDTPPEISAEFRGKGMKYAGRYYSEAEDPTVWEKGVEAAEKSPPPEEKISPPTPSPKPVEKKMVPLGPMENERGLTGTARVQADGILILHADGKEHRFSFLSGPFLPPGDAYRFRGQLCAGPGERKGERRIMFYLPPVAIPGRRGPVFVGPTLWQWQETVLIKE